MQKLQIAIYVITIVVVLVLVLMFWGVIPGLPNFGFGNTPTSAAITVWGTVPENTFSDITHEYQLTQKGQVAYVQKNPATYEEELINALASGIGPDVWMMPQSWTLRHGDKVSAVPASIMTERVFTETFADAATNSYLYNGIVAAIPVAVDPLVLFWNKDFFASDAIALPPRTWDEFLAYSERLTRRGPNESITRAGSAMGLASNIPEAKDILSLLIIQGGTPIVDPRTRSLSFGDTHLINNIRVSPTESALRFYTDFGRRNKESYTWNNTFSDPISAFAKEQVAMVIGYASNASRIRSLNSHIAFGVSPVPQFAGTELIQGYARVIGFAVSNASKNQNSAWRFLLFLSSQAQDGIFAEALHAAPSRRDILQAGHEDPIRSVTYESALRAKVWFDPNEKETNPIFANMIESAAAGSSISSVVLDAQKRLRQSLGISR